MSGVVAADDRRHLLAKGLVATPESGIQAHERVVGLFVEWLGRDDLLQPLNGAFRRSPRLVEACHVEQELLAQRPKLLAWRGGPIFVDVFGQQVALRRLHERSMTMVSPSRTSKRPSRNTRD